MSRKGQVTGVKASEHPVYEVGDEEYHAPERGYHSTRYTAADEVHPHHFGFEVSSPPRGKRVDEGEQDIPLANTQMSQRYLYKQHVHNLATVPGESFHQVQDYDPVEAVRVGSNYVVEGGHHRTAAAKVRGDETVRARVSTLFNDRRTP